jgi:hypothetical protein
MSAPPALCTVVRILEVKGPKGGQITVLLLRCGSWITRRLRADAPPPVSVWCIACYCRRQLGKKLRVPVAPPAPGRPH